MALIVCPDCGKEVSSRASVCIHCGCPLNEEPLEKNNTAASQTTGKEENRAAVIDNYLAMAKNAYNADNNSEAELYCNKIIEIDITNHEAWMLKGKAAAWQSTLANSRVDEGVTAFINAIKYAPEDEKDDYIEEARAQIKRISIAMLSLRGGRFAKWPDEEETSGFLTDIAAVLKTVVAFISQTGENVELSEIMGPIATEINQSVVKAWKDVIWRDYNGDPDDSEDRASKYEWQQFIERVGYCTTLVEKAIGLCSEDDEEDITRYENLIIMHNAAIDSCAWDYDYDYGYKRWYKTWSLTDAAKSSRRSTIRGYEAKIKAIKDAKERKEKEMARQRFNDYWAQHAKEKAELEADRRSLEQQISSLKKEINNIPGKTEKDAIQTRIAEMTKEMNSLGIFKVKEKKALQEKIDAANQELKTISDKMEATKKAIESKITPLQQRINRINTELTKAR